MGIMTAARNSAGCALSLALATWATHTTMAMTKEWIAMLITLTPPPTRNCLSMLLLLSRSQIRRPAAATDRASLRKSHTL